MFGLLNPWAGIALVICAIALLRYVKLRAERGGAGDEDVQRLERRLGEVERRLTDIQDIMLSIDEKLDARPRLESTESAAEPHG